MTSHPVQVQRAAGVPLAVIRGRVGAGDLSRVVPEWCGLVWEAVRLQEAKGGRHVAVYWDDAILLEAGVELMGPFAEHGNVVRSETPTGTVASVTHLGPYGRLGVAHDIIHDWSRATGNRLAGPRWEIYGHWQREWNEHPSHIRTDVCYLLAEGG